MCARFLNILKYNGVYITTIKHSKSNQLWSHHFFPDVFMPQKIFAMKNRKYTRKEEAF